MTQTPETITYSTSLGTVVIHQRKYTKYMTNRSYNKKPRIFVWADSQENETILEDLHNRTRRPHQIYKAALTEMFAELGLSHYLNGLRWDQHAGCTCPCSPGFVANFVADPAFWRYDISVSLTNLPCVDETKPARELAVLV